MRFLNRTEAGRILAQRLENYKGKDVIVYALPRGGVVVAREIARYLDAPLDVIIIRKIGYPNNPEYAIAAITENGQMIANGEIDYVDQEWLKDEFLKQRLVIERRRKMYFGVRKEMPTQGKIAILVDDGIATGLTMRAGILDLRKRNPQKIVVAVPVIPQSTYDLLKKEVDAVIAFDIPSDDEFLGAVGAYYRDFSQVNDEDVLAILASYKKHQKKGESIVMDQR